MAAAILTTPDDLEQVRKALDASLTVEELPDTTIQLPFYLEVGEAMVTGTVPDWQSVTGVDQVFLRAAVVAQVAALLAPAMPGILPKSEEGLTYKVTREQLDWDKRAGTLQVQVASNLGRIRTRAPARIPPSMMVSGPTRKGGGL